jgi:hypothetical protein
LIAKPETFDNLNRNAQPYPAFLLPDEGSALCLFAAGFWGWNDAIHMVRKGLTCDFVDTDGNKLWEMLTLMPEGHAFHVEDSWAFASRAAHDGREWDVVSVDPFMGDAAERSWETLYLWLMIARKMVTLTVKTDTQLNVPEEWNPQIFPRNDRVAWLVMQRA